MKDELDTFSAQPGSAPVLWFANPQLATYGQFLADAEQQSPIALLLLTEKMTDIARQRWPNDPDQAYATRHWQDVLQTGLPMWHKRTAGISPMNGCRHCPTPLSREKRSWQLYPVLSEN